MILSHPQMNNDTLTPFKALLILLLVVTGLALDQKIPFWGQWIANLSTWALLLVLAKQSDIKTRISLALCVCLAGLGEYLLSNLWGLYDYRLRSIPAFVPPGHALIFILGCYIASKLKDAVNSWVPALSALPVMYLALSGHDTLSLLLYLVFLLCMLFSKNKKLYAVMFVLALGLELYGTYLGNWQWRPIVPLVSLVTLNPPLSAGVFYCLLDLLTVYLTRQCSGWLPAPCLIKK